MGAKEIKMHADSIHADLADILGMKQDAPRICSRA